MHEKRELPCSPLLKMAFHKHSPFLIAYCKIWFHCLEILVSSVCSNHFFCPTLFMELDKWKEMQSIINSKQADQGLYVNLIGDKCYILCFSQIHPSYGCRLKDVYANRHTATNDSKRWKRMIEIPKTLSQDMSDYKSPQLS